jgi:hypothetical protein
MHNVTTHEIKVHFRGDLLINALVDVIVLVRGFGLATLEVFVELVVVLE